MYSGGSEAERNGRGRVSVPPAHARVKCKGPAVT